MKKAERKARVRRRLRGRGNRPRLSVFVSNKHIYAQIIDDRKGMTLAAAVDSEVGGGKGVVVAEKVGKLLGQKAKKARVKKVLFDRGERKYHGRVKALAEAARGAGLEF